MTRIRPYGLAFLAAITLFAGGGQPVAGQLLGLPGGGSGGFGGGPEEAIQVSASFTPPAAGAAGRLFITATLDPGWHIYATTQSGDGPRPTKIDVQFPPRVQRVGDWMVVPPPQEKPEPAFGGMTVESHAGTVTWFAPIEFAAGVDPATLRIPGTLNFQPCDASSCFPPMDVSFVAQAVRAPPVDMGGAVSAEPPDAGGSDLPVEPGSPAGNGAADGSQENESAAESGPGKTAASPNGAPVATSDKLLWRPYASLDQFESLLGAPVDLQRLRENATSQIKEESLWAILVAAFFGGLILNIMPCVLPVIGLKVLSFIDQAGESRSRAFALNVAYAAGLLSIFLLLATLAAFAGYGWGKLFSLPWFNVAMATVIFAMALSFLGIWEIPIPGFVGSGKMAEAAGKEGLSGAFAKGVVTTILATPCTGPFMGTALVWAVAQPPATIYAVFLAIGLGMASPYLLIGAFPKLVAFLPKPGAWMDTFKQIMGFVLMGTVVYILTFIKAWYVVPTVGLLFAVWAGCWWIARTPYTAPASRKAGAWLEAGVFVALMWVLMFPGINELVSGRFAFPGIYDIMLARHERTVESQAYIVAAAQQDRPPAGENGENTVLMAFTADWCATCKTLEGQVLDTPEVRALVARNNVVPVKADYTDTPPEVTRLLESLGARQVPVVAVFPAGSPNQPTGVFHGWYSQQEILDALEAAGPSRRGRPAPRTAGGGVAPRGRESG